MKYKIKIFAAILFLIFQSILIAQNDIVNLKSKYTLSDTIKAIEYYEMGKSLAGQSKNDSSNIFFQKSIDIYENLIEQSDQKQLWIKYIQALNYFGYNLCYQAKYEDSKIYLSKAKELCFEKLGEENKTAAQIFQSHGIYFDFTGDYEQSIEMFKKALSIRIIIFGENHSDVADTYNSIGIIYAKRSNLDMAFDYFLKSLDIKLAVFGEEHSQSAVAFNNIGIIYADRGDYGKALEYYQKALGIRLRVLGEQNYLTASSYNNIGNALYNLGEYEKAKENHHKSLSIRKSTLGSKHGLVATSYNNLGLVFWKLKELTEALEYFNDATVIRKELFNHNHPSIAESYMNIGLVYFDQQEYQQAINYYNKSLIIWNNLGENKISDISKIYQNLAEAYINKNEFDSALTSIQKAIIQLVSDFDESSYMINPQLIGIQSEPLLLNALKTKAKIFMQIALKSKTTEDYKIEYLKNALSLFELADSLIDIMRVGYKNESSKFFLGEKAAPIYEQAIESSMLLFELTQLAVYKEKAFYFIEKSKAAVLQEGMIESRAKHFAKIPPGLIDKEKKLKIDLTFNETQLQNELRKKELKDSLKISSYENELFELKNNYERFINDLEKNYPAYYDLKYQTQTKTIQEIQYFLDDRSVILEYFIGDSSIKIAVISKNDFDLVEIKKPSDFTEAVRQFYSSILKSETDNYIISANLLTELLITPIGPRIESMGNLIIIPHDVLFKLPFETLFLEKQKPNIKDYTRLNYLIKDFDISYHYSAALFVSGLEEKNKVESNEYNSKKNFIGFAPVFPKNNLAGYTISTVKQPELFAQSESILRFFSIDGKNYDELKYSEWEVNSIIDLFNNNNSSKINTAYFYADAKEDSFKTNVKDYKIVHIASHSFMNEEQPDISGVIFAQPADSVFSNDGILYSGETYNLDLSADLIVLSSCESGLGKLFRGEGMMALNRGFLYSGASNIVFSLWKIPDKHTSELMVEFYKQQLNGKSYSESLRQAKLKLINDEKTARPRSWAGFLLIGSD